MTLKSFVFIFFFCLEQNIAYSGIIYVGPSRPYTEIFQVTGILGPGDTVFVDGDHTYQGDVSFTEPGTQDQKIAIIGVRINGNRPTVSGGTNTVAFISPWPYENGADHYIFQGFEVTGGSSRGIYHQSDDLTIRDVLVRDCPAHGVLGADQGSGSCTMEFVEVRNCGNGSYQHQIYMATDEVHHPGSVFRMQFCYVHDADGGNNVKSRAERNEIYYNWVEGGYYHELELIGCDGGDTGNIHLKREDSDVVGNVLVKKATSAGNNPEFYVVRIGGDGTGMSHGRYRFVNNTIICGTSAVFRCFDTLETIEMHNNVFFRQSGNLNIIRTSDALWVHDTAVIAGSDNWVCQGAANIPSQWTGTIEGSDPGFVNFSEMDLRILPGSPLIGEGNQTPSSPQGFQFPNPLFPPLFHPPLHESILNPVERPVDGQIDIGAYEYGSTSVEEETNLGSESFQADFYVTVYGGEVFFIVSHAGDYELSVYDLTGRAVDYFTGENTSETELMLECVLKPGHYFAVLKCEGNKFVRSFQTVN